MKHFGREARLVLLLDDNENVASSIIIYGNKKEIDNKIEAWKNNKGKLDGYSECYGINNDTHISRCYVGSYTVLPSVADVSNIDSIAIGRIPHYVGVCMRFRTI